ncbi:MAG: TIGR01777 family oxidoreductase, partial [Myxococcota bacterium]
MKISITGSTGMIGEALVASLSGAGHEVKRILRKETMEPSLLAGQDAVINLAGANLAEGRWTVARRRELVSSRIDTTTQLATTLVTAKDGPKVVISASAVGFYGVQPGDRLLDESSPQGSGFLAEICKAWEAALAPAASVGVRVVNLRFGPVLSPTGGALAKMLPVFRMGLGGRFGDGEQVMSWVAIDDVLGAIEFLLSRGDMAGAFNVVSPEAVSNREFTAVLGHVLHKPAFMYVPGFSLKP